MEEDDYIPFEGSSLVGTRILTGEEAKKTRERVKRAFDKLKKERNMTNEGFGG